MATDGGKGTSAERMRRMRARRAAEKAGEASATDMPAAPAVLRDTDEFLWPAVAETLAQLDLQPEDAGVKKLAQRYAQIIDQHDDPAWCARWIFPALLDTLVELGASPGARARLKTGKPTDAPVSQLAKLRAARKI